MDKKSEQPDWLQLAVAAAAKKSSDGGYSADTVDWYEFATCYATVAQATAQTRIAAALESIVEALHNRDGVNIADNIDILCAELVNRLSLAA